MCLDIVLLCVVNLDLSEWSERGIREGQATDSHSCSNIREVPDWLRNGSQKMLNIQPFYTKYTEAYNISIVGEW